MITVKIEGMTCGHCVMQVKKALSALPDVKAVEVSLEPGEARVEGDVPVAAIIAAVEAEGYSATLS